MTFSEGTAGAGVGSGYERRPIDLVFEVRDTLRSAPTEWVLGNLHDGTYNTGTVGLVNNTASAHGVNTATGVDVTTRANDEITIIDSPLNVSLEKAFDQDVLGLPQAGTAPADFPLISSTIKATNSSATRVSSMVITDPAPTQTAPTAFEVLNLYSIDGVTIPAGMSESDVSVGLTRAGSGTTKYVLGLAKLLKPADLADVIGIEVTFARTGNLPIIGAGATGELNLTWQLRSTQRTGGAAIV